MTRTASLVAAAVAAGTVGLLSTGTASAALPSCAVAPAYGTNLIANGGAEDNAGVVTGTGSATRVSTVVPNCWTTAGSALGTKQTSGGTSNNQLTPAPYTWASGQAATYPNAPIANQSDPAVGKNLFYGGDFPFNASSSDSMTQTIDVSSLSPATGTMPTFTLSGLLGGYYNQTDSAMVTAAFQTATGTVLGSSTIGPVTATDRGNISQLLSRSATGTLPVSTAKVVVTATLTMVGTGNNNGYADNLSFALTAPGDSGGTGPSNSLPEIGYPVLFLGVGAAAVAGRVVIRRRRSA
jgi:hypothetical protein